MNIAKRLFVILLCGISSFSLQGQIFHRQKEALQQATNENEALRYRVDSLLQELERQKAENRDNLRTIAKMQELSSPTESFNLGPDSKDSISLWSAIAQIESIKSEEVDLDSVKLSSAVSDDVYLERIKNMNNIFALPYNDIVRNYVILYSEKRKSWMPTTLGLCSYYFPIFQETFNRYGIPEELAALAMVESNLNPVAVSKAGARGMWQFMYAAAKSYGLRIDSYVDERLDILKASDAAARYLLDAYKRFGDWSLAISSYNCGSGNINRAIARSGGSTNYWDIYNYLPKETRGYVPAFVGALYITKYYKEHGMNPQPCALPEKVDTFVIRKKLHYIQLHDVVGVPIEELRLLNPQYVHDIIPGNDRPYVLRLPRKYCPRYVEMEDSVWKYKADSLFNPVVIKQIESSSAMYAGQGKITYKVRSGDTLGAIAKKYHTTVTNLKKWNGLKSTNIGIGQRLYIYTGTPSKVATPTSPKPVDPPKASPKMVEQTASPKSSENAAPKMEAADTLAKPDTTYSAISGEDLSESATSRDSLRTYIVRKGDTLYGIARQFPGVSIADILARNGNNENIHPGDTLRF